MTLLWPRAEDGWMGHHLRRRVPKVPCGLSTDLERKGQVSRYLVLYSTTKIDNMGNTTK